MCVSHPIKFVGCTINVKSGSSSRPCWAHCAHSGRHRLSCNCPQVSRPCSTILKVSVQAKFSSKSKPKFYHFITPLMRRKACTVTSATCHRERVEAKNEPAQTAPVKYKQRPECREQLGSSAPQKENRTPCFQSLATTSSWISPDLMRDEFWMFCFGTASAARRQWQRLAKLRMNKVGLAPTARQQRLVKEEVEMQRPKSAGRAAADLRCVSSNYCRGEARTGKITMVHYWQGKEIGR